MGVFRDITGQTFGKLTATKPIGIGSDNCVWWECACSCGNIIQVSGRVLRCGGVKSCGCLKKESTFTNRGDYDGTSITKISPKAVRTDNQSSVTGVHLRKSSNKWIAQIMLKGKNHYLGSYVDFDDAVMARKLAEKELFSPILDKYHSEAHNGTIKETTN